MPAFLDFPRETRDRIYELNLVHGTIPISTTKQFLHTSYGQLVHVEPKDSSSVCGCKTCTANPRSKVQPIPRRDIKRTVRDCSPYEHIGTVKNTAGTLIYELQQSYGQPQVSCAGFATGFRQELVIFDSQNLSVFLTNRQIYQEASKIFYSRNKFDFGCCNRSGYADSLKNVSGFIQDRSEYALGHLKSIRFALGGDGKEKVFEQYWYKSSRFTMLCETLAEKCKLVELNVGIFGINQHPEPHPCLEQLTKIKNLQRLHISMDGPCEMGIRAVESALATIKISRSQSLLGGDKMGEKDIEVARRPTLMVRVSTWKAEVDEQF